MKYIPNDMHRGATYNTKNYGELMIIEFKNASNVIVKFKLTGTTVTTRSSSIRSGSVKDLFYPIVYGVGFLGGKKESSDKMAYKSWVRMLERCYSDNYHKKRPTYIGCTVCDEWHNFQSFKIWHSENYIDGYQLDKDIRVKGNKIYSPSTCAFVSSRENSVEARAKEFAFISPSGELVAGVNLREFALKNNLSQSHLNSVRKGKRKSHKGWIKAS